jgi:hypothetical protein
MTDSPVHAGRSRFDIGDIVRAHRPALEAQQRLTPEQKRVLTDIAQCRTAALGGHLDVCATCGYEHPSYNSCRNRHCPKCQALAQEVWIEARREQLLDLPHYHVVFTLPAELRPLAQHAPPVVFNALFHAASQALLELGRSRLGVTLGATLVLHTWTRQLTFHPHVHAIVTAGGLTSDEQHVKRWGRDYLVPVQALGLLLRGKVLAELSAAYAAGAFATFEDFRDPRAFAHLVGKLAHKGWNVYCKPALRKVQHVVNYLGRYTHRVGIANSRLLDVTPEHVEFRTKNGGSCTLSPVEFLGRFVQHVLPEGFHKIRHIGLYASACQAKLALARQHLKMPAPQARPRPSWQERLRELTGRDVRLCPVCLAPLLHVALPPPERSTSMARAPPVHRAA